jgi:hypothetical protein
MMQNHLENTRTRQVRRNTQRQLARCTLGSSMCEVNCSTMAIAFFFASSTSVTPVLRAAMRSASSLSPCWRAEVNQLMRRGCPGKTNEHLSTKLKRTRRCRPVWLRPTCRRRPSTKRKSNSRTRWHTPSKTKKNTKPWHWSPWTAQPASTQAKQSQKAKEGQRKEGTQTMSLALRFCTCIQDDAPAATTQKKNN